MTRVALARGGRIRWRAEKPLRPGEYIVEFRVVRRVRVRAADEIQAELEAARKLSRRDRDGADSARVVAGRYEDGQEYRPGESQPWYGLDRDWWAENDIE